MDNSARNGRMHEFMVQQVFMEQLGYNMKTHRQLNFAEPNNAFKLEHGRVLIKNYRISNHDSVSGIGRLDFFDANLGIGIECRYQEVAGTTKDKLYAAAVRLHDQPFQSFIVYDGEQYDDHILNGVQRCIDKLGASDRVFLVKLAGLKTELYTRMGKKHRLL